MSQNQFSSRVPEHLLEGETPAMKYLITELSKNTQATEFLLQKREESGVILEGISQKLDYTNGAIAEAKREIYDLQKKSKKHEEISEDLNQIVLTKRVVCKLGTSKVFWIVFGCAIVGLLAVFTNVPLAEFLPFLKKGS
jgi:hypothetical protein